VAIATLRVASFKGLVFLDVTYDDVTNILQSFVVTNNSNGTFTVTASGGPLSNPISFSVGPHSAFTQPLPGILAWTVDVLTGDLSFPMTVACGLSGDS
jgi:hypothetical protein